TAQNESELDAYDYELPKHLIAQQPLSNRTDARLMVVRRDEEAIEHRYVRDLPTLLGKGDCLVLNDSRVVPARLVGKRTSTGGRWEGLFLDSDEHGLWQILSRTRGKLTEGETVTLLTERQHVKIELRLLKKQEDGVWIALPETDLATLDVLELAGRVPLPCYIRGGEMIATDRETYQTVYAREPGSVAAPTAGLHFTEGLLEKLQESGIAVAKATLHVGLDTFRPIKGDTIADHQMHTEWCRLNEDAVDTIESARARGGRVVAVGTTSTRVLETAARDGQLKPFTDKTDLFIKPGFEFHAIDALMTNFHLPRTTLQVLVCTFGGHELIRHAYEEAVKDEYRFYSYGDAMLII
ncbi:MAG: tRNA preQ1(34) S-adenosylmethionine ribosyltransferase-isomerase QueA, partial [Pirellulales bacterium]|nr:tRNA preQ1(34) S-adenosylmethionine ribosyltransferase-isomerase QueA [Pirellulales bacterium]